MGNNLSLFNNDINPATFQLLIETIIDVNDIDDDSLLNLDDDAEENLLLDSVTKLQRAYCYVRRRLDFQEHVQKSLHEGHFESKYRMSYTAFTNLVLVMSPHIEKDASMARYGGVIPLEIVVAIGIRYLAGEKYTALMDIFNVCSSAVYQSRDIFINALFETDELKIKPPQTQEEWDEVIHSFDEIITSDVHRGNCCGALDGFFQRTCAPNSNETSNPDSYFSGHYYHHGLNCQAMCDGYKRFLFFFVAAPGKVGDSIAITKCIELMEAIKSLPRGKYVVSDAAYDLLPTLLTPFTGSQRDALYNDAFNFWLSQIRIRIEMAFGLLTAKWWILKSPLDCSMRNNANILMACAILHNYVINQQLLEHREFDNEACHDDIHGINNQQFYVPQSLEYIPTMPEHDYEIPLNNNIYGNLKRQEIVRYIAEHDLTRPTHNVKRNTTHKNFEVEFFNPN